MQSTGEEGGAILATEAADFTAELLADLAEIAQTAGLIQSAAVIAAAIHVVKLEATAGDPHRN